jgi:hypothetical protein
MKVYHAKTGVAGYATMIQFAGRKKPKRIDGVGEKGRAFAFAIYSEISPVETIDLRIKRLSSWTRNLPFSPRQVRQNV